VNGLTTLDFMFPTPEFQYGEEITQIRAVMLQIAGGFANFPRGKSFQRNIVKSFIIQESWKP
jgi:hypothetical protein